MYKHNNKPYITLIEALEVALPKFNTGASGLPLPMLAKAVNWKKVIYPCFVQPKLDGVRCLVIYHSLTEEVTFLSRTGKTYTTLSHIGEELVGYLKEDIILDGELYSHDLTFQEIVAAVKKQRENSLLLKFRVYDIVNASTQADRTRAIESFLSSHNLKTVEHVPTITCNNKEDVINLHNHYVKHGYEGVIIRQLQGAYECGQRSNELVKVKEFDTNEFAFDGWELGQRGVADLTAICRTESGRMFKAKMKGTTATKQEIYNERDKVASNTLITVRHFDYTDDKLPRFPIGIALRDYE